jgi:myosin heavy subunit
VLGFTLEEQDVIFRIISSILHLGNVYFHRKQLKHGEHMDDNFRFLALSYLCPGLVTTNQLTFRGTA